MNDTLVSISCITYNHAPYIRQTLDSFLMQKVNFKYEILIHDDASTDGTQEIIKEYQEKYPDIIKPILQNENQYSKGVKRIMYIFNDSRAKGKYIALCEGDDYWTDLYKLQNQVDYMEEHEKCSMCFHAAEIYDESQKKVLRIQRSYNSSQKAKEQDLIAKGGEFCMTNSMFYRKSALDNAPEFFLNAHVGDYSMQLLFMKKGYVYYIDKPMSAYRISVPGSWTSTFLKGDDVKKKQINNIKKDIELLENFNSYSNNQYYEIISSHMSILVKMMIIIDGKKDIAYDSAYKKYYDNLSALDKCKLFLHCNFPCITKKLHNIKFKITNGRQQSNE